MNIRIQIKKGTNRVLRGGSWNNTAANCRVANRNNNDPSNRNNNNGFRVVLSQLKRRGGCLLLTRFVVLTT
jgi:formylglycine-generating enzyme required for sulfatase activity